MIPEPNIPAKPVPEPKYPTTVLGKPLQNPRVVLSPKEQEIPMMIEETRESQKAATFVLYRQQNATIKSPAIIAKLLTSILMM